MVVGLFAGSTAAIARTPPADSHHSKKAHAHHKKGNMGHEGRSNGAGH
jgi:hypothetical protein